MQGARSLVAALLMISILMFALIHLGVAVGVLVRFRDYNHIFRPERGVAGFNVVISFYGLLVGGFGLFSVLTDRGILGKIVALAAIVLALFAFASLITALIVNSLAINYVSSQFSNQMNQFTTNQDAKNVIDKIQTKYNCCGNDFWLEWVPISLNAPSTNTTTVSSKTTTSGAVVATTTTSGAVVVTTTTSGAVVATTATTGATGATITIAPSVGTTLVPANVSSKIVEKSADLRFLHRTVKDIFKNLQSSNKISNDFNIAPTFLQKSIRRKRQTQSNNGTIDGLPISSSVTLPQSCCTNNLSATNNLQNLYCVLSPNGGSNNLHTDGCLKKLGKLSVGQTLGFVVINSFLAVLALAAIPVLLQTHLSYGPTNNEHTNQPMPQNQQQYVHGGPNSADYNPGTSYNNYNDQYSAGYNPGNSYNNYNNAYYT